MRFISASRPVQNDSLDQVRLNLEKRTTPVLHPGTIDQPDRYEINMRVHIKGKGSGFHIEIQTLLLLKETRSGIELTAHSDVSKPLLLSTGLAVAGSVIFFFLHGLGVAIFPFFVIFPIVFIALLLAIRKRAAELLKVFFKKNDPTFNIL